ncbi:MAG: GNAT family N-acetyltransferase [Clostridia bacterium]|nr:GNAT family N-acetyltransferase [Clostridia bacterium]
MTTQQIASAKERSGIARAVLEKLTDWFGIDETREQYIADSEGQLMVAAMEGGEPVGFLCLKETGRDTAEIAVMGVVPGLHRRGVGRALVNAAREAAASQGYSFLQVKTVKMGCYAEYDRTNLFYQSMGFKEFEVFPQLWDEANPCQIYVTALK